MIKVTLKDTKRLIHQTYSNCMKQLHNNLSVMFFFRKTTKMSLNENINSSNFDLSSLVKLALNQKVSWSTLKLFLHELTSTYETSKQLNVILLEELQILHSKTIVDQTQDTILEAKEQETVENGSNDEEIMVLFTKQETIDNELKPIGNQQTDDDDYGSNDYEIGDHNDEVSQYDPVHSAKNRSET